MEEIWKPITGYEGYYEVSSLGRVRSLDRRVAHKHKGYTKKVGGLMKAICDNGNGYKLVYLYKFGSHTKFAAKVHRLVAEAFIPNPCNYPIVDHIDRNKANNQVTNLRWCTQKDNVAYRNKPIEMIDTDGTLIVVLPSAKFARDVLGIRLDPVLYGGKSSLNGIQFRFKL